MHVTAPQYRTSAKLTTIHVTTLAMSTATSSRLRTRSRTECRATVVAIVESTLSAVTVTGTSHFYVIARCLYWIDRQEGYGAYADQCNHESSNLCLHNDGLPILLPSEKRLKVVFLIALSAELLCPFMLEDRHK